MEIREIMIHEVRTLSADESLRDAVVAIKAIGIDLLPVEDRDHLIGMVTLRSVEAAAAEAGLAAGSESIRKAVIECASCRPNDDVEVAIRALDKRMDLPGLLVVEDSQIVGVVTLDGLQRHRKNSDTNVSAVSQEAVTFDDIDRDPVDHMSEESFPASDPAPPPASLSRET